MEHFPIREALGPLGKTIVEAEVLRQGALAARTRAWLFIMLNFFFMGGVFLIIATVWEANNLEVWACCLAVAGIIVAFLIYMFVVGHKKEAYTKYFAKNILAPVLARCLPGWTWFEAGGISSQVFNDSQLFGTNYNIFRSTDLIQGSVEGLDTSCSSVLVQRKTTSYRNGKRRTNTTTLFSGIFMEIRLPESLHTDIFLYPDTAEKLFGALGTKLQSTVGEYFAGKGALAHTGDHEFEKYYVVYCPHPFKAIEVLNAQRRTILSEMARETGNVRMCIRQNRIYVALPCGRDWAVPDIDHASDETALFEKMLTFPGILYRLAMAFGKA